MSSISKQIALLLFTTTLCACSTIDSSAIPANAQDATSVSTSYAPGQTPPVDNSAQPAPPTPVTTAGDTRGIAYFLPRQLAKVTAKRSEVSLDNAIKGLGEAELGAAVAKAQVASAKSAIQETENSIVTNSGVAAVRDLLLARLAEQKKSLQEAESAAAKKELAKSAAKDAVTAAARQPNAGGEIKQFKVAVGIELLAPTADPAHGYRLNPKHSAFRDDEQKLVISPGGLLTSVDIVAADRTADALVEIATFAGAISSAGRSEKIEKCQGVPEEVSAIVDLTDAAMVKDLNKTLNCMGAKIVVDEKSSFPHPTHSNATPVSGIVYRTPIDVLVTVQKCQTGACVGESGWFPTQVLALSLPQAGPISQVPQNAGLFTRTTYGLAFKDGILTNYSSNRPSEVLEVARTPMRLVNGFFDGASKVISLRTGQNTAQTGLTNSELALAQARNALLVDALAGQKKLTDQELATLQSQIALQTGQLNGQAQLSAADLAAMLSQQRDQARRDAINRCIGEKVTTGQPIDPCLSVP